MDWQQIKNWMEMSEATDNFEDAVDMKNQAQVELEKALAKVKWFYWIEEHKN